MVLEQKWLAPLASDSQDSVLFIFRGFLLLVSTVVTLYKFVHHIEEMQWPSFYTILLVLFTPALNCLKRAKC